MTTPVYIFTFEGRLSRCTCVNGTLPSHRHLRQRKDPDCTPHQRQGSSGTLSASVCCRTFPHPLSLIQQATSTIRADMNACACTLLCICRRYLRLLLHQVHGTQTADGGYVVVGKGMEKDSSSKMEAFAIKFNSLGMYSWVSAQFGVSITALCKVFGHSISKYSRTR